MAANAGYLAVSVVPELKGGHPVADITLLKGEDVKRLNKSSIEGGLSADDQQRISAPAPTYCRALRDQRSTITSERADGS